MGDFYPVILEKFLVNVTKTQFEWWWTHWHRFNIVCEPGRSLPWHLQDQYHWSAARSISWGLRVYSLQCCLKGCPTLSSRCFSGSQRHTSTDSTEKSAWHVCVDKSTGSLLGIICSSSNVCRGYTLSPKSHDMHTVVCYKRYNSVTST